MSGRVDAAWRERFAAYPWDDEDAADDGALVIVRWEIARRSSGARASACVARRTREGGERDETGRIGSSNESSSCATGSREMTELMMLTAAIARTGIETKAEATYALTMAVSDDGGSRGHVVDFLGRLGLNVSQASVYPSSEEEAGTCALWRASVTGWEGEDEKSLTTCVESALNSTVVGKPGKRVRLGSPGNSRRTLSRFAPGSNTASEISEDDSFNDTGEGDSFNDTGNSSQVPLADSEFKSDIDGRKISIGEKVSSGTFASLYRGVYSTHSNDGTPIERHVALKYLKPARDAESAQQDFFQEVNALRRISHPNIVTYIGSIIEGRDLCLVTELAENGTLLNFLTAHGAPSTREAAKWALGIAKAFEYLHDGLYMMHRDLKASNVLLDGALEPKICDFGLARVVPKDKTAMTAETGTYRWMAPEVIVHAHYTFSADVYSFAILLWELVTGGKVPYSELNPLQAAVSVAQHGVRPDIPSKCDLFFREMIEKCWGTSPTSRPSFKILVSMIENQLTVIPQEAVVKEKKTFFSRFRRNKRS